MPYFIIVLCLSGAMYPAMDLTAGEKERGTIETILSSPVSRVHLVLGKFFMVLTAALFTARAGDDLDGTDVRSRARACSRACRSRTTSISRRASA